jgi:predicted transcriptional regulator
MTSKELADELHQGCKELGWTGVELARAAGVTYETARRALGALGSPLLSNTTKLLVAVRRELVVRRITTTQVSEEGTDHPPAPDTLEVVSK